jgi:hypothetical protein
LSNATGKPSEPKKTELLGYKFGYVVGIIIVIVIIAIVVIVFNQTRAPNVKILATDTERYNAGSILSPDYRATITASVHNYEGYSVTVTMKFETEWAGETHSSVKTAVVEAHSTVDVVGDVQATDQWFYSRAELIQVTK